jgi:hypothetical protein
MISHASSVTVSHVVSRCHNWLFDVIAPCLSLPRACLQAAEKEVRGEVSGILRDGKAASSELAAAEAAAEKAVSSIA